MPEPSLPSTIWLSNTRRRRPQARLRALRASPSYPSGETVGLVGESGSGKTTLGRAILASRRHQRKHQVQGTRDRLPARRERRALSSEIQVVFQDPYSSLNPSLTIEQTLTEPLTVRKMPKNDAMTRVRNLLDQVKLPRDALGRLPREFSGGQRIAIARALALSPEFIVCDEPVSALDLSTQARVLDCSRRYRTPRAWRTCSSRTTWPWSGISATGSP